MSLHKRSYKFIIMQLLIKTKNKKQKTKKRKKLMLNEKIYERDNKY